MIPCRLLACSCHEMQLQSNLPTNYLGQIARAPPCFDLLALPIVRLIVSRCFVCRAVISGPVVLPGSSSDDSVGRAFCFSSVLRWAALLSVAFSSSVRVPSFPTTFVKHSQQTNNITLGVGLHV